SLRRSLSEGVAGAGSYTDQPHSSPSGKPVGRKGKYPAGYHQHLGTCARGQEHCPDRGLALGWTYQSRSLEQSPGDDEHQARQPAFGARKDAVRGNAVQSLLETSFRRRSDRTSIAAGRADGRKEVSVHQLSFRHVVCGEAERRVTGRTTI